MAAPSFKTLAAVCVAATLAVAASAQDLDMAPAPAPIVGAAFSLGMSGAVICSSLLVSMVALLKN